MKYNKYNSFYSNFGFYIISPGRISGVASHGHGASSLSLWVEEWLVLGCHYKSIMWHLYKEHERRSVFITNAHQASAMAQVRGESDPVAHAGNQQSTPARNPQGLPSATGRWHSSSTAQCWWRDIQAWACLKHPGLTCSVSHCWKPPLLQPLKIFILSWSLHPVKHNEPPKLTPCDTNTACLGEGGVILK